MDSPELCTLDVEAFSETHPALDPGMMAFCRAALGSHEPSPRLLTIHLDGSATSGRVRFAPPDPRTAGSYEQSKILEHGAVVIAALLLARFEAKQITRVAPRGSRVDYFVGEVGGDDRWILEVSGTDSGSLEQRRAQKHAQLEDSFYRRPPFSKDGFVSVTRFAPLACATLDAVAAERDR